MPDSLIVPLTPPDSQRRLETCTRGFSDRFGDRLLTFDRGTATPLELLRFKPELSGSSAFESGLRDRVERAQVQSLAVAPALSVERWDGALVLVSRHSAGRRLSEALAEGRGAAVALDFLRQMTPALAALAEANGRFGHGALTLDRVVATHDGRLTLVEHPLGTAAESLGWPVTRLQSDLSLAVPPAALPMSFDRRIDPIQLGFVTLSLMLGRRVEAAEYPKGISKLLDESAEAKGRRQLGRLAAAHVARARVADRPEAVRERERHVVRVGRVAGGRGSHAHGDARAGCGDRGDEDGPCGARARAGAEACAGSGSRTRGTRAGGSETGAAILRAAMGVCGGFGLRTRGSRRHRRPVVSRAGPDAPIGRRPTGAAARCRSSGCAEVSETLRC